MFRNSHLARVSRTLELGNGAVLSVESSLLSQNSLLTGKLNKNSFHLILKSQFYWVKVITLAKLTGNYFIITGKNSLQADRLAGV